MVLQKKITFHRHEVVGAQKVKEWMEEFCFDEHEINRVTKLVRHHQFRFYDNTSKATVRKWMEELGSYDVFLELLTIRRADRTSNPNNANKPDTTKETGDLTKLVGEMLLRFEIVFPFELHINLNYLTNLGVPVEKHHEAVSGLLALVREDPTRNNHKFLTQHLRKVYKKEQK